MGRAPCCDKANVKKGPWSPEEDAKLKAFIEQHGTGGNWIALPQKAGLRRCGKSCRLRWLNYLRPDIKHGGFSEEEDNVICNLYASIGSRWSIIAAQLPGRTDNDIKNYWNTKLKKKLLGKHTVRRGLINASAKELGSLSKVGKQYYYVTEGMCTSTIAISSDQNDVLYGSDPVLQQHEMNMTLNSPYSANLGPPMVFEHAPNSDHTSCLINFQSPLKPASGFVNINPHHDHDQELEAKMTDNLSLKKLLLRIESVLSECSTNNNNNNNTSAQISSSNISSQIYSQSTTALDHVPGLQSDSFETASRMSMNVKSEPVGAFDAIHALNSSMSLRDSCSSSDDQSAAWLNGLNAAQEYMNCLSYEFNPMELNEVLQWNNNNSSLIQQQQRGEVPCNYSCRISTDEDLYTSAISWAAQQDEEPSNCSDPKPIS